VVGVYDYGHLHLLTSIGIQRKLSPVPIMVDIIADTPMNDDVQFKGYEVTDIIESIRSASSEELSVHGSSVFDSSAMAPLSPASAVSQPQQRTRIETDDD